MVVNANKQRILALEANSLDRVANFIAEFSLGGIARLKAWRK
jgi:hypothetical protein